MKTISAALKSHLEGEVLTVCTLWKITRADATVFGFTDCSHDLTYLGVVYLAATGHIPSSIKTSSNLSVDNLEVQAVLDSATITEADILAGLWDFATVEIMRGNYMDLTMGHEPLRSGTLGNIKTGRFNFIAELRGKMQPLQQTLGRVYSPGCDADLGDARCGVTLASFTVTGTVTTATSARVFTGTARTETDGYFDGGLITWTSGNNDTYSMEVKSSTAAGVITL